MRAGIIILPDQRWREARRRWRLADEYGFSHAWTYDHLGWRDLVDATWFDAIVTLTAAATVTSRIGLGTMVASANFRHPVHLAREVTALDDICAGRLILGLGSGGNGFDTTVLGQPALPPGGRSKRFAEFVELLDLILRDQRVTWRGSHYAAVDARAVPGCMQSPRVPFVVAASGPRSIRLAAGCGDGWVTTGTRGTGLAAWWRTVGEYARRFDEALGEAGRTREAVRRYLSLDSAPVFSLSSPGYFAEAAGRAGELGFTDVLTHWPRDSGWYAGEESVLDAVAAGVLPAL